jgi:hypothetical protein
MKTVISVTFMITGLIMLAQPVRGGPRGGGGGFSGGGAHFSGGGSHFSGASAHSSSGGSHFSSGVPRLVGEGTHFASFEVRSSSSPRPHTFAETGSRIISRTSRLNVAGVQSRRFERQSFDGRNHIVAREGANWHRDWDRHHDHFWRGHRCRFVNGTWIIFDEGFFPDDYYPYGYYPDDYSYDNYNAASVYPSSSYDSRGPDSIVLEVQEALQTAGYEPGSTDGVFGPSTREAIGRYQRDHGLDITGDITDPVLQALGLE